MKTLSKLNVILFTTVLFLGGLSFFVIPRNTISIAEKRRLAVLPALTWNSYLNGGWSDSIDKYINDQFPVRLEMIDLAIHIKSMKGLYFPEEERIVVVKKPKKEIIRDITKQEIQDTVHQNFLSDYEESYSGSMLIINGGVFTLNAGSTKMSKVFSKMLNEYAHELGAGCRVFSCVPPLSSAFIPIKKYESYNRKNVATLLAIKESLSEGAIFCDVMKELNQHINEKLFFRTDHHWTPRGAYYGYVAFCKAAGIEPTPMEKMERKVKYNFLGSLYEITRDKSVKEHADTMEYFIPNIETTALRYKPNDLKKPQKSSVFCNGCSGGNSYSTFLCGDIPLIKIKTNVKNEKKALVIKNSMGNAFSVFLVSHYEEIYVLDFRYSEHNILNLIRENEINDLIFAVGMYGAMSSGTIQRMRNLGFNNRSVHKKDVEKKDTIAIINSKLADSLKNIK